MTEDQTIHLGETASGERFGLPVELSTETTVILGRGEVYGTDVMYPQGVS